MSWLANPQSLGDFETTSLERCFAICNPYLFKFLSLKSELLFLLLRMYISLQKVLQKVASQRNKNFKFSGGGGGWTGPCIPLGCYAYGILSCTFVATAAQPSPPNPPFLNFLDLLLKMVAKHTSNLIHPALSQFPQKCLDCGLEGE